MLKVGRRPEILLTLGSKYKELRQHFSDITDSETDTDTDMENIETITNKPTTVLVVGCQSYHIMTHDKYLDSIKSHVGGGKYEEGSG